MNPANIYLDLMAATLATGPQQPCVDFFHAASDVCVSVNPVPFMTEKGEDGQDHRHYAIVVYGPEDKLASTQEVVQFAEAAVGMMILHNCAVAMRVPKEPHPLEEGVVLYPVIAVVPFLSLPDDDETAH